MIINPEKKQYSIVLVGDFNPVMFQPEWFSRNLIISPEEVDFAKSQTATAPLIVTPQLTAFKTSQFSIKIEQKRFQVICEKEPFILIKDFVVKTFEKLGGYTLNAYGFNYSAHYAVDTLETYQRIGDNLAPKQYWSSLLGDEIEGTERKSGLTAIQMQKNKEDKKGQISLILQPSILLKPGVFMSCNDHSNIDMENSNAEQVIEQINRAFDESVEFMSKIQIDLLTEAIK